MSVERSTLLATATATATATADCLVPDFIFSVSAGESKLAKANSNLR